MWEMYVFEVKNATQHDGQPLHDGQPNPIMINSMIMTMQSPTTSVQWRDIFRNASLTDLTPNARLTAALWSTLFAQLLGGTTSMDSSMS